MSIVEEILVPDIGDFADVEIIEILVAPGERIAPEQSLLTLESDKATIEIPAPIGGVVKELLVKTGDRVSQGDRLMRVEREAARSGEIIAPSETPVFDPIVADAPAPVDGSTAIQRAPGDPEPRPTPILPRPEDLAAIARGRKAHASPAVRRFARELGVNLAGIKGSGPKGRVLKEDVQAYVKRRLAETEPLGVAASTPAQPADTGLTAAIPDFARFGPIELQELPRIKRLSGRHLHRCWTEIPHVTQFDEADITELEAFRQAQKDTAAEKGVRLTLLPFLLKATAKALAQMPVFKSSLTPDGERLVYKQYTHIGVAVDTPQGLVVPVVCDVEHKGLYQLAAELAAISDKARAGKLTPSDLQGGCFSISSLGGIGGTAFTPIVNAPEVAILGVARASMKPVWNGHEFVPRLMLPLALSYDHRVIDGADGARFITLLSELLGDIRRLLL
ncbi:dihydrolipoyllysine-residue acetyltransferase [Caldichromatium japonicum]|uniref:Acetyltransferase component of pyruvate dehydrogenase complex n=1 Tax=Caldichromatium japonicum TaxID=2699430 RepID=A0A6G7VDS6_9GAMM|nr:dihydrolipoyllysine-residue acetyltransferase [Caldichromatium japonicum]QIK37947.1 dihydrolipoyllysine-residue acetyltransferase [Caldichromatium japonicum]